MMATMFESSLSASISHPPLSSADAPSMADSLPSINFGFEDLRDRMARFTDRFDDFIARGRRRVLEERNQFRISVTELHEQQRLKRKDLEILAQKSTAHAQSVQREAIETSEMHAAIESITQQRDARTEHRNRLRTEIATTTKLIAQRLAAQQQYARELDAQVRLNAPELAFWTSYLCLRIEGAGREDRLRFVFSHLSEKNWEREGWFELDTERRDYQVVGARPKLNGEAVKQCVEGLNENRNLGIFLRGMRALLATAMEE